jgi:CubicO group peptidase (beta-lactamase class C family)
MLHRLRYITALVSIVSAALATPAYDFTSLTAIAEEANTALGLRGAGLRVMIDGQPVYQRYFGAYSPATIVPIASASKTLSAAVLLALVDEGKLSLDDKVSKFIPSFNKLGGYADITLRQCFSHTSGLPGSEDNDALSNNAITLAQSADLISQIPLIGPPGAQFAYGGLSMQVAGRCAEVASGKSWDQLFREKITIPLGLNQVDFTTVSLLAPYRFSTNPRIAGGARCSLGDYSTFVQMLANRGLHSGRRILSEASVREMQRAQTNGLPIVNSPLPLDQSLYGIGAWITLTDTAGLTVETTAAGAFGFTAWFDQSRRLSAVYLVLDEGPMVRPYVGRLQAALRSIADTTPRSAADVATRLDNLSIRATAGTGAATLIAGFVLADGDRTLLLRGIGPGLAAFGVSGAVADPMLSLFRGSSVVATNDNWTLLDGRSLGAFPLASGSSDAVLAGTLAPGGYTAQISPVAPSAAGAALAEIYDAGSGSGRLTNLSARSTLGGGERLIAGFTITGASGSLKKLLIRATGPGLVPLGVTDAISDPKLEVYDGGSVLIAHNDDWTGASALSNTFASVGAFPFPSLSSKDAALVMNLPPGGYTVQISGVAPGNTLVEVYELK